MDNLAKRMDKVAEALGLSLAAIGQKIGVSRSTMAAVGSSKNGIPSEYLRRMHDVFPQVSIDYIVLGTGPVTMDEETLEEKRKLESGSPATRKERVRRQMLQIEAVLETMKEDFGLME